MQNVIKSPYVGIKTAEESSDVLKLFEIFPVQDSGYSEAGASTTRRALIGMIPNSSSANRDVLDNLQVLRQRSRMLYQSTPIAASAVKTATTNVIGVGLKPKPAVDIDVLGWTEEQAREFERAVLAEFALWANDSNTSDALGMDNFYELQGLAFSSMLMSGDAFALVQRDKRTVMEPYTLRIRLIEADRCRVPAENATFGIFHIEGEAANGNKIYDGVEVNTGGKVVAYHIANTYPNEISNTATKFERVEAVGSKTGLPNILHLKKPERPDQYRGVPFLAQITEELLQLRRYTEGELAAAIIQSFWTAFIETEDSAEENLFGEATPDGESPDGISRNPNEYEVGAGTINFLRKGEKIVFGQPTHPSTGFDVFTNALCNQIGAALEIPSDLLLKKFGESYSASRAELLEAWKMFKAMRENFVADFCRPIYKIWMTEAVALGRINAPGFFDDPIIRNAYLGCDWVGESMGQLNPIDEVKAAALAIETGLSTREIEATKYNGSDYNINVQKLRTENELLSEVNRPMAALENTAITTEGDNNAENNNTENE